VEVDAVGAVRWRHWKNWERRSSSYRETTAPLLSLSSLLSFAVLRSSTTDAAGRPWSLPQSSVHVVIVVNGEAAMNVLTARRQQVVNFS
jgi:hypothetical protein